jgi:hypothetical protein
LFGVGSFAFLVVGLCLLVTFPEPNPENFRFFTNMDIGTKLEGVSLGEYFGQYFSSLDVLGWGKFVGGVLLGVFIYIGIPTLVGKYGGEGWK